jgi:hypothetical protein
LEARVAAVTNGTFRVALEATAPTVKLLVRICKELDLKYRTDRK